MLGEQLIIKLWDTIADKGIGSLLIPWQILREGDARTEVRRREIIALAKAEKEASEIINEQKNLVQDIRGSKDVIGLNLSLIVRILSKQHNAMLLNKA